MGGTVGSELALLLDRLLFFSCTCYFAFDIPFAFALLAMPGDLCISLCYLRTFFSFFCIHLALFLVSAAPLLMFVLALDKRHNGLGFTLNGVGLDWIGLTLDLNGLTC